jgi:hypothetical protein
MTGLALQTATNASAAHGNVIGRDDRANSINECGMSGTLSNRRAEGTPVKHVKNRIICRKPQKFFRPAGKNPGSQAPGERFSANDAPP